MKLLMGVADAARLFARTDAEISGDLAAGTFPAPYAYIDGKPLWQRETVERLADRYWKSTTVPLLWVHPKTWPSASAAAKELAIYRHLGASIYCRADGRYAIHVPARPTPAKKLRMLQRYGSLIQWELTALAEEVLS